MHAKELKTKLRCLLEELIQNREHAAQQYEVGGLDKNKLATSAWDAVKDAIDQVGKDLALSLRFAYGEVWRYNIAVELGASLPKIVVWKRLLGKTEGLMSAMAIRAKLALIRAEQKLSAYLAE